MLGRGARMRTGIGTVSRVRRRRPWPRRVPLVGLDRGCTWFEVPESTRSPCRIRTPELSVVASRSTFVVTVESEGSCFVVVLDGAVTVTGPVGGSMVVRPFEAVHARSGAITPVTQVSSDELARDPWIVENDRPGAPPTPQAPVGDRRPARGVAAGLAAVVVALAALTPLLPDPAPREVVLVEGRTPTSSSPPPTTTTSTVPSLVAPPLASNETPVPGNFSTTIQRCQAGPGGVITASGVLVNEDPFDRRYEIEVTVVDGEGAAHRAAVAVEAAAKVAAVWSVEVPSVTNRVGGRCDLGAVEVVDP